MSESVSAGAMPESDGGRQRAARRGAAAPAGMALLVTCWFVALLDGFDTQAIAFAAPSIKAEWAMRPGQLGLLFSAGLAGGLLGIVGAPIVKRRLGYRLGLISCAALFSIGSVATLCMFSANSLIAARFVAGIPLGTAIPLLNAISIDLFAPGFRSRSVALILCGSPIGGFFAGIICALVIPHFGWRTTFWIGALAPLLAIALIAIFVPRSSGKSAPSILVRPGSWASLFRGGRGVTMSLVALVCFCGMMVAYSLVNWTPTLLKSSGYSLANALAVASLFNLGSFAAMLSYGALMDRYGVHRVAAVGFILGAPFLVAIGFARELGPLAPLLVLVGGFLVLGTPVAMPLLASAAAPEALRMEAVSGSVLAARAGGVLGPIGTGLIVSLGGSAAAVFGAMALVTAVGGIAVVILRRLTHVTAAP